MHILVYIVCSQKTWNGLTFNMFKKMVVDICDGEEACWSPFLCLPGWCAEGRVVLTKGTEHTIYWLASMLNTNKLNLIPASSLHTYSSLLLPSLKGGQIRKTNTYEK